MRHRKKSEGPPVQGGPTQNQNHNLLKDTARPRQAPGARVLRRRRNPFPFGNLRRLQTNGQLGTWLDISTAKLRSVTGEASS